MTQLLTAAEVREAMFSKPQIGKRGYHEDDVDEFLDEVAARLEGRGDLTAEEVRDARFRKPPWGRRGYNEADVDALLDRVAATLDMLAQR